jgi:hypothetical protein
MEAEQREKRRRELNAIRSIAPGQLIAIYRGATGLTELAPLGTVTLDAMIDAILEHERNKLKPRLDN